MEVSDQLHARPHYSRERVPSSHWIGGWVGLRAGLDDVEKRKFLHLSGLEIRPLGCQVRNALPTLVQSHCVKRYKHGNLLNVSFRGLTAYFRNIGLNISTKMDIKFYNYLSAFGSCMRIHNHHKSKK
jgi:hypothetical protein